MAVAQGPGRVLGGAQSRARLEANQFSTPPSSAAKHLSLFGAKLLWRFSQELALLSRVLFQALGYCLVRDSLMLRYPAGSLNSISTTT